MPADELVDELDMNSAGLRASDKPVIIEAAVDETEMNSVGPRQVARVTSGL